METVLHVRKPWEVAKLNAYDPVSAMMSLPPPPSPPKPPPPPPQLPLSSPSYHWQSHIFLPPSLPILFYFHLNSHLLDCHHTPFVIPLSLLAYAHRQTPYNHPHCLKYLLCLHLHCYLISPYLKLIPNQFQTLIPLQLYWIMGVERFLSVLMQSFSLFLSMVGDMIRML